MQNTAGLALQAKWEEGNLDCKEIINKRVKKLRYTDSVAGFRG